MKTWKVKLIQEIRREAEIEVEANSEQEAIIEAANLIPEEDNEWVEAEVVDQYVEDIEEL